MEKIRFEKYLGAGGDFVFIDRLDGKEGALTADLIANMCDRNVGVGAQGLVVVNEASAGVKITYYNADGAEGTMCGNATRCTVHFAQSHDLLIDNHIQIQTCAGLHMGWWDPSRHTSAISMPDVTHFQWVTAQACYTNTGSPHYVEFVSEKELTELDIIARGRPVRYSDAYRSINGTNVNFVAVCEGGKFLKTRTYQRGVEDEILGCGTGAVAAAIAYFNQTNTKLGTNNSHNECAASGALAEMRVVAPAGELMISFTFNPDLNKFENVRVCGASKHVFSGEYYYQLDTSLKTPQK